MLDEQFLKILRDKLAHGSTSSVLLNCIPGASLSRIDVYDLNFIEKELSNNFVTKLLSEENFSFDINYQNILESELEEERKLQLERLSKKLNRIYTDNELSFQEKGHRTFGFGYPTFVMEIEDSWVKKKVGAKAKEKRLVCAPLFIWPLEIFKSFKQNRRWMLKRSSDDIPFINDTFASFIKQKRQVDLVKALNGDVEELINYDSLQRKVSEVVKSINSYEKTITDIFIPSEYVFPLHTKEELKERASINGFIEWSGVFSLYSKQKQSLINEIDQLIEKKDEFVLDDEKNSQDENFSSVFTHGFSAIDTDHSQQAIIDQLKKTQKFIIQGPPGTGKSQTLTALITNALSNGAKCLVVCEKTTALEVIYNNLSVNHLDGLCALINDPSSKDRQKIVEKVRAAPLLNYPRSSDVQFNNTVADIQRKIKDLSEGYDRSVQLIWEDQRWCDMLGRYLKIKKLIKHNPLKSVLTVVKWELTPEEYKYYSDLLIRCEELYSDNLPKLILELNIDYFLDKRKGLVKEQIYSNCENHLTSLNTLSHKFENLPKQYKNELTIYYQQNIRKIEEALKVFNFNYEHLKLIAPEILEMSPSSIKDYLTRVTAIFSRKLKKALVYRKEILDSYSVLSSLTPKLEGLEGEFLSDHEFIPIQSIKENIDQFIHVFHKYVQRVDHQITTDIESLLNNNEFKKGITVSLWSDLNTEFGKSLEKINQSELFNSKIEFNKDLSFNNQKEQLSKIIEAYKSVKKGLQSFSSFYDYQSFFVQLNQREKEVISAVINYENINKSSFRSLFDRFYLEQILLHNETLDLPKSNLKLQNLYTQLDKLKSLLVEKILSKFSKIQTDSVNRFPQFHSLYNLRGSGGRRRNSLRQIINHNLDFFTNFFPVVLTNPTACATLFPLKQDIFDVIIFDEASQLRLEDTYSSLLRGKIKVISGDQHQMPPPRAYEPADSGNEEESDKEDDLESEEAIVATNIIKSLANSESLLDYAITTGYKRTPLLVHYRSNHQALIQFSNNAFYSGNLLPIIREESYTPITFCRVDGLYTQRTNPLEADKAVEILDQLVDLEKGICPSVGIATFNLYQRDLVNEKISHKAASDPKFAQKVQMLNKKQLFVKNLENIQGDERDVIIMTTTFGKDEDGKFRKHFGPLNNKNGYRLLNVIITRAKNQLFVCTSIPEHEIIAYERELKKIGKNDGVPIVFAYLAYAKAVSDNNKKDIEHILQVVKDLSTEYRVSMPRSVETESPFEEEVYDELRRIIDHPKRIESQVWIGPFRVDFLIRPKNEDRKVLIIECDGASYHGTTEAYAYDNFRLRQLNDNGYVVHKIWSSNWWDEEDYAREVKYLVQLLDDYDNQPIETSRFYKKSPDKVIIEPIQVDTEDEFENFSNQEADDEDMVGTKAMFRITDTQQLRITDIDKK